jgi:hypothetical protein
MLFVIVVCVSFLVAGYMFVAGYLYGWAESDNDFLSIPPFKIFALSFLWPIIASIAVWRKLKGNKNVNRA